MKKLTVKKLIDFRGKSAGSKKKFIENIKSNKAEYSSDGGGDYWKLCTSAISRFYPTGDLEIINAKIEEVAVKREENKFPNVKVMYQRNIDILKNARQFNLKKIKPAIKINILKKSVVTSQLIIKGLEIQALPNHFFTYKKGDIEYVGGIWFAAKLEGFTKEELGMYAELLFRCIRASLSKKYTISPEFCIAIDILKNDYVSYSEVENGEIRGILMPTLEEISRMM